MKPFLKWAGGKSRLVPTIEALLPPSRRLVEPFMGSGAVFLGVSRPAYLVADVNRDLVDLYASLSRRGSAFVAECRDLFSAENNTVDRFMALRAEFNATAPGDRRSALFVYLNRHCFNGLCRYSASGRFNVPFGRSASPHFPEREMLAFAERAATAEIRCQGFEETMAAAREGDVVYCDPPYVPLSPTASFDAYAAGGFTAAQQRQLAAECVRLRNAEGVACVVSNHDTPFTREIYADAILVAHDVRRSISGKGERRGKAAELFAVFLPPGAAVPAGISRMLEAADAVACPSADEVAPLDMAA